MGRASSAKTNVIKLHDEQYNGITNECWKWMILTQR